MVRRITTNGMMNSYKSNLMRSYNNLANVTEKVTTHRQFNSYAEDPAKASQAFQLRRNRWNVENQLANNKQAVYKYQQAWNCMDSTYQKLGTELVKYSVLRAENDPDAGGRQALGEVIRGAADSVMETMNAKYGDNFVFSGADGQTVPFSWGKDKQGNEILLYRGMQVDVDTPSADELKAGNWENKYPEYAKLFNTVENEHTYIDLGMGMKEGEDGQLIGASAFDTALSGIDVLGYGTTSITLEGEGPDGADVVVDDVPNNIISLIREIGDILSDCSPEDGSYASADDLQRCDALEKHLFEQLDMLHANWMAHDTEATFLKSNQDRLESLDDTLNEQITGIEDVDPAEAITALMWAQYSYNAALRIGTSILSQSLIDYMS